MNFFLLHFHSISRYSTPPPKDSDEDFNNLKARILCVLEWWMANFNYADFSYGWAV